jgi:hypothetical protein
LLAGSYGGDSDTYKLKNPSQALTAFPTTLNFVQDPFTSLAGADWFAAFGAGRINTQFQISEDVVKTWQNQKLGFGANLTRIFWTELPNKLNAAGQLGVQSLDAFYYGGVDPATPTSDFTQLTKSFTSQSDLRISFLNFGIYGQDEWHARPNLTLTAALRAEHYSNPICQSRCFARFGAPFESANRDPSQPYDKAILTNQRQALLGTDNVLWSPRFSFAWQPLGLAQNVVLRGGFGVFYDPVPGRILDSFSGNTPNYNLFNTFGDNLSPNEQSNLFLDAKTSNAAFLNGFATGQTLADIEKTIPGFTPPALNVSQRIIHSPQYRRWSLEWQQAFGASTSFSMGYYGHHGTYELVVNNSANAYCNPATVILPSGAPNPCFGFASSLPLAVPDARFSQVTNFASAAQSNYNGMVVSFKHRFSRWTQGLVQANYTYGHALDEVSNGGLFTLTSAGVLNPQDPNNVRGAYGSAEYDARHSLNASYFWELPVSAALQGHGFDWLVKGWQVSGTVFARTGFPYTVFDPFESGILAQNNYFGLLYGVPAGPLAPGPSCGEGAAAPLATHPCLPPQFFVLPDGSTTPNPNAWFVQAGCETGFNSGNLGAFPACSGPAVSFAQGRNHFRGPNYFNTDFAIMKTTRLPVWEKAKFGIGLQFFNLLNHPSFGFPDSAVSDQTFGQIFGLEQPPTSVLGSGIGGDAAPRMIQLKAQLQF